MGDKLDTKSVDHCMIDSVIGIGLQTRGFYSENIMEMYYMIYKELEDSDMSQ